MNVNKVLERFRKAEYPYPDVIWHDIRSIKLKQKLTAELVNITAEEFKALLVSNLFLPERFPENSRRYYCSKRLQRTETEAS